MRARVAVGEHDIFALLDVNAFQLPGAGHDANLGLDQQVLGGAGQGAEAVDHLLAKVGKMIERAQAAQPAIELELDAGRGHVVAREIGPPAQLDRAIEERLLGLVGQRPGRRFQQRAIELVADALDVARLLGAQDVAGASDLQVAQARS